MTHERDSEVLLGLLRHRWGDEPGWTLRPNKDYGFYLLFRGSVVSLGDVRQVIEDTFGFANGPTFILGHLPEVTDQRHNS